MRIVSHNDQGHITLVIQCGDETSTAYLGVITDSKKKWVCNNIIVAWKVVKPCKTIKHKADYLKSIAIKINRSK